MYAQAPHVARQVAQLRVACEEGTLGSSELVVGCTAGRLLLRAVAHGDEAVRFKPHVRGALHPHARAKVTARRQHVALGHDADCERAPNVAHAASTSGGAKGVRSNGNPYLCAAHAGRAAAQS